MQNKIFQILLGDFNAGHFIRVGENNKLCLYVGKDEMGRFAFDFRGQFKVAKTNSSEVISVAHINSGDECLLRFSLESPNLLECFSTFCEDLISSTQVICDDQTAYQMIRSRYFSWKQLFRPNHGNLSEYEIMGLIGELLFLKNNMIPLKGIEASLDSWAGPERSHKDFSYDNDWYEIKTMNYGKESVRISSLEQLDSSITGHLVIYTFERMSASFNGLKLNALVNELITLMSTAQYKETFLAKLSLYGFDFSPDNDNFVYDLKTIAIYKVDNAFPRFTRTIVPNSIVKVQYEILVSDIEDYKV